MSDQKDEVPAFLKGDFGPVDRATGGGVSVDYQSTHSPAPLNFGPSNDYASQWNSIPGSSAPRMYSNNKYKSLDPELGHREPAGKSLTHDFSALSMTKQPVAVEVVDLEASEDEREPMPLESDVGPDSIVLNSKVDGTELLREISLLFDRSIDTEMDLTIRRIRGVAHDKCERCNFSLQLHSSHASRHILTFSRRSGSAHLFANVLATTRSSLRQASFCQTVLPSRAAPVGEGGEAAAVPEWAFEEMQLDAGTCTALVGMCRSEFVDVQREALSTLASLLSSPQACSELEKFSGRELVGALAQAGRAVDGEVQWLCAYIAAHLCTIPSFCADAMALVPTLFGLLTKGSQLEGRGCQRQSARALELITRTEGRAVLRQAAPYLNALEQLFHHPDQVLRASIRLIVQQLTSE